MKVWVYEYLSGGGVIDLPPSEEAALLSQGTAMRDALVADLSRIAGCRVVPWLGGGSEAPADLVRRQAAQHDRVWVIAPESGRLLASLCEAVHPARWIGSSAAAIRLATSKRATLEQLAEAGIATPLAFVQQAQAWVVKPDDGAGAVDTQRHGSLAEARADFGQRQRAGLCATLEPWVDGEALSISLLCSRLSAQLLSVNRQRIAVDGDGTLRYEGVQVQAMSAGDPRTRRLRELAGRIVQALPGLRGYVGVDIVWHRSRGPVVIEINPRVTSAYVGLSAAIGRNVAAEAVALHQQELHV